MGERQARTIPVEITDLPFVQTSATGLDFWCVSPTDNYVSDYEAGARFARYAKQIGGRFIGDVLFTIVSKGDTSGIAIGFIQSITLSIKQ